MTLEAKLHELWESIEALESALPVARVFTGIVPRDTALPYASIMRPMSSRLGRSDKGVFRQEQIRIQVWSSDFDAGQTIQTAIADNLDNRTFALTSGKVIDLECDETSYLEEGTATEKLWQFLVIFTATTRRDRTQ